MFIDIIDCCTRSFSQLILVKSQADRALCRERFWRAGSVLLLVRMAAIGLTEK